MQIEIDFDVFKGLTSLRESESDSYNNVIRRLLDLPTKAGRGEVDISGDGSPAAEGYSFRGLKLPEGTQLRVNYKGRDYRAVIRDGRWVDEAGVEHLSPSGAAHHITGTNVNGWRFWEAKRPNDSQWRKLDAIPKIQLV